MKIAEIETGTCKISDARDASALTFLEGEGGCGSGHGASLSLLKLCKRDSILCLMTDWGNGEICVAVERLTTKFSLSFRVSSFAIYFSTNVFLAFSYLNNITRYKNK